MEMTGLPLEAGFSLADIARVAREGRLAMSVAAAAVMQEMFEAEITAVAGLKGKHDPGREVMRHGAGKGSVTLGGRRCRAGSSRRPVPRWPNGWLGACPRRGSRC